MRRYSAFDNLINQADYALRTVLGTPHTSERPNPAAGIQDCKLSAEEARLAAGLMRVNHAGEVSAQALYQGQALTARLDSVRAKMERAAMEENDHLAWTESRLSELHAHKSVLNPIWYCGSFALGALAGAVGDKWSLGFVAETELQVVQHLEQHLQQLPVKDLRSLAILKQMKIDEAHHATTAIKGGAAELPWPVKKLMAAMSKVMTSSAYYL